jgi:hypothetical protein
MLNVKSILLLSGPVALFLITYFLIRTNLPNWDTYSVCGSTSLTFVIMCFIIIAFIGFYNPYAFNTFGGDTTSSISETSSNIYY